MRPDRNFKNMTPMIESNVVQLIKVRSDRFSSTDHLFNENRTPIQDPIIIISLNPSIPKYA